MLLKILKNNLKNNNYGKYFCYKLRNICRKIRTIHNHKNDYRTWETDKNKMKYTNKYRKNGIKWLYVE